jgi:hypothetical protein
MLKSPCKNSLCSLFVSPPALQSCNAQAAETGVGQIFSKDMGWANQQAKGRQCAHGMVDDVMCQCCYRIVFAHLVDTNSHEVRGVDGKGMLLP